MWGENSKSVHLKSHHTPDMSVAKPVRKSWCTLQSKIIIIPKGKAAGYEAKGSGIEPDILDLSTLDLTALSLAITLTLCVKTFYFFVPT